MPKLATNCAEHQILEQAASVLAMRRFASDTFCSANVTAAYLGCKLSKYDREVFAVMLLDSQHRLIRFQEMFIGSIDSASVYPREIVKVVLEANAAAVVLAHNHPSGVAEPSHADRKITQRVKEALALIDVPVLDHIIVGEDCVSFAQRGLL